MNCVTNGVGTVALAYGFLDVLHGVEGSLSNNFNTSGDIGLQVGSRFTVSGLRAERQELLRGCAGELTHAQARDYETGAIHLVNDFASLNVSVGLDNCERSLSVVSEVVTR